MVILQNKYTNNNVINKILVCFGKANNYIKVFLSHKVSFCMYNKQYLHHIETINKPLIDSFLRSYNFMMSCGYISG